MKNESFLKKVLLPSFVGFPIGVTSLVIAYISVYYIAGDEVFCAEISQLQNVNTLISQAYILGLAYYIMFFTIKTFIFNDKKLHKTNSPYKLVIGESLFSLLVMLLVVWLIGSDRIFSRNIALTNCIIMVSMFGICGINFMIKDFIENILVKKINNKIKENNK